MLSFLTNSLAGNASWLAEIAIKSTVLLAIGLIAAELLKRRPASIRHCLRTVAMAALLLLPLLLFVLPSLRLAVLPATAPQAAPITYQQSVPIREAEPPLPLSATAELPRHQPATAVVPSPQSSEAAAPDYSFSFQKRQTPAPAQPVSWPGALVLLWIVGAMFFALRLAAGILRVGFIAETATPVEEEDLQIRFNLLRERLGIARPVALLVSGELDVPIAAGVLSPKVVLSRGYAEWDHARLDAVLCHELAHIKRWDAGTHFVSSVAAAIFWFHPLAWLMLRGMRIERERACDDYVLQAGARASDYAHDLLEIVSQVRRPQPAAALAMARRSQLEGRVLALVNPQVRHGSTSLRAAAGIALAVLAVAVPLSAMKLQQREVKRNSEPLASASAAALPLPTSESSPVAVTEVHTRNKTVVDTKENTAFALQSASSTSTSSDDCLTGHHKSQSISSHSENGYKTWTASWSADGCSIEARSAGTVRFSPDAMTIEGITSGGYFEVNQRFGDRLRHLRVEPESSGQLKYSYSVNGNAQPFDASARQWLSEFLLQLERTSAFAVDTRVPALLAKGGPNAVLAEIDQLQSDYARDVYFRKLLDLTTLPPNLAVKAIDQAGREIHTDYDLAQVLLTIAQKYGLDDEGQRAAFLNASSKLNTDYEHSRVLIELLKRPNLSPQTLRMALDSARNIHTDYEKSRILVTLAGLGTFDERELDTYLALVGDINTDYERSRSIMALMEHQKLNPAAISTILKTAAKINTDYEKSRVLLAVNESNNFDEKEIPVYLKLVDSVNTDYERSRDLIALMERHHLGNDSVAHVIAATQRIGTDYEKARVLVEVAQHYPISGEVKDAYLTAAKSIGTEYERNRTLAALNNREAL